MNTVYETIVGMEIHVELKTKSKMFCGCKNDPFFASDPNIYTCPVCLGMPGGLPVPNKKAIEWTIKLGLALGCEIPLLSKFDRKNYFYPDLSKGYQISQYDQPFCINGKVETSFDRVGITRVHLEEDTGKLLHTTIDGRKVSLVDFNRSGVPLVEIVTEPDIRSGEQAKEFLKKLHQIVQYLDISDADMEKGSMRLEPNISVRRTQNPELNDQGKPMLPNYKVEVKNINSFNFVKKAIEFETERHIELLEEGKIPKQETRGWDENKNMTVSQRSKEEAEDYRYFPEPDIPPIRLDELKIKNVKLEIPELPDAKVERFKKEYGLDSKNSELLTDTREMADYYEECVSSIGRSASGRKDVSGLTPQKLANWIINKKPNIEDVLPAQLVSEILKATEVVAVDAGELESVIARVIAANEKAVTDYKAGKEQAKMFLFGMVLKELQGKGDKKVVMEELAKKLS